MLVVLLFAELAADSRSSSFLSWPSRSVSVWSLFALLACLSVKVSTVWRFHSFSLVQLFVTLSAVVSSRHWAFVIRRSLVIDSCLRDLTASEVLAVLFFQFRHFSYHFDGTVHIELDCKIIQVHCQARH